MAMSDPSVPASAVIKPPSCVAGLTFEEEKMNRAVAAELIHHIGVVLEFPQTAIYSAQQTMHKFYSRASMQDFPILRAVLSLVFLTGKAYDCSCFQSDVVIAADRVLSLEQGRPRTAIPLLSAPRLLSWRNSISPIERAAFLLLGCLPPAPTATPFTSLMLLAAAAPPLRTPAPAAVVRRAWALLCDSGRTAAGVIFAPEIIAAGALWLALHWHCSSAGGTRPSAAHGHSSAAHGHSSAAHGHSSAAHSHSSAAHSHLPDAHGHLPAHCPAHGPVPPSLPALADALAHDAAAQARASPSEHASAGQDYPWCAWDLRWLTAIAGAEAFVTAARGDVAAAWPEEGFPVTGEETAQSSDDNVTAPPRGPLPSSRALLALLETRSSSSKARTAAEEPFVPQARALIRSVLAAAAWIDDLYRYTAFEYTPTSEADARESPLVSVEMADLVETQKVLDGYV